MVKNNPCFKDHTEGLEILIQGWIWVQRDHRMGTKYSYVGILMEFPTLFPSNIQEENPSGKYWDASANKILLVRHVANKVILKYPFDDVGPII